jgi:phosphoglycerol transferase MdoB-like AlkP superfamily enzyme
MSYFKDNRVLRVIYFIVFSLSVLTLLRVALWVLYRGDFSSLTTLETLQSFLMGVRVDLISIATFSALFILFMLLPFKFTYNKRYQNFFGYLWYVVFILMIFIIMADIVYFQFVHRHIGQEIRAMSGESDMFLEFLWQYKGVVFLYIFSAIFVFWVFKKIMQISTNYSNQSFIKRVFTLLVVVIFLVLSIRGKITGKPFGISDAFTTTKSASGNLALNGFFTLYRTNLKKGIKDYKFYDDKKAIKISQSLLTSNKFKFIDNNYPLMRALKDTNSSAKKYNVVIILLESWASKFVDSFGHNNLNVTPNFDKIAAKGITFPNFYANGQRSIEGITALFTGIPALKNFNYIGSGLELSNLSYIGDIAKENNYSTISMQSSKRGSFRIDSISKIAGFDSYYGAEDIPWVGDEDKNKKPAFGTWDGNMYAFLLKKLSVQKEPFLSFAFTSTTHTPFRSPGKKWEVYKHNDKNIFGYLNTLKYADDKLGEFIKNAKKQKWFDNTIFIFMADHTVNFANENSSLAKVGKKIKKRELEEMKIPLVIYAPKIFKPSINYTVGSQADIIPTLIDILNWKSSFTTISNSLFANNKNPFAIFKFGNIVGFVEKDGYIKHTLKKRLEMRGDKSLEEKLLSLYQVTAKLLKENRLYKGK